MNHKNFVNLIGYCEEDEPFTRMMVFEYAPNGPVFEHLHGILPSMPIIQLCFEGLTFKNINAKEPFCNLSGIKDAEHLDWTTRMRIIMGTAYCLRYMHHDLNPPVAHSDLNSLVIYLTDDYAAKVQI